MPITYAGVPVEPPNDAQSAVDAYWHGHRIDEFEHQGYFLPGIQHLPTPYIPKREPPAIGRLHWPTGADRWAVCHLIATYPQVAAIRSAIGVTPTSQDLVITDGTTSITTQMYCVVRPIKVKDSVRNLYLLTLFDDRWWWWQAGAAEAPATASSWSDLITSLFSLVGVSSPTISTVPSNYLTPNMKRWDVGVQPIPLLIEAACRQVGMRVVRRLDGTVRVENYEAAKAVDDSRWTAIQDLVLSGGRASAADIARIAPASVDVRFLDGTTSNKVLTDFDVFTTHYEGVSGVAGKKGLVVSDAYLPTAAEKDLLAAQAVSDYYVWFLSTTDVSLRSIQNIHPCGLDEFVEWVHSPQALLTRIVRPQWSDRNIYGTYKSQDSDTDGGCTGCGWVEGLLDTDCLRVTADGTETDVYLTSADGEEWTDAGTVTIRGVTYTVTFNREAAGSLPTLSLSEGGSGADITGRFVCCDCCYAKFAFAEADLDPEAAPAESPCDRVIEVRVDCSCCPIDGWAGEGWYCVEDTGPTDCVVAELLDADKCDDTIVICSGPYATEAEASAECPASGGGVDCTDADGEFVVGVWRSGTLPGLASQDTWHAAVTSGVVYCLTFESIPNTVGVTGHPTCTSFSYNSSTGLWKCTFTADSASVCFTITNHDTGGSTVNYKFQLTEGACP